MLNANQRKAAELLAFSVDMTKEEIAKECRVSRATLWKWETQNQEFMDYIQTQIMPSIKAAAPSALKSMKWLSANANNENVRYSASKDILDRAGYKAKETIVTEDKAKIQLLNDFKEFSKKIVDNNETE